MPVETLSYETPQFLQKLLGHDLAGLRHIAGATGAQVTSREAWVRLEGGETEVRNAREVFVQLERLRRQGGEITPSMLKLVTESVLTAHDEAAPAEAVMTLRLAGSAKKPPVLAKTRGQIAYVQAMRDHEVVFGIGPAGTGKTYLAMAQGLHFLREKQVQRLVLTRPAVEAGEALGFLPGDLKEKIFPYLRPLYDALYDMLETDEIQKFMDRGIIEIAPLAYMRGRTLNHSFVVLDEAQNTTAEQMFMFLTRLGNESKCVITGDRTQIDLPRNKRSGLLEATEVLQIVDGIAIRTLHRRDVVRHPLVQAIINAYELHREANTPSES